MNPSFTYKKNEKLKRRKQLAELFESKQSFLIFPVKVFYLQALPLPDSRVKAGVGANSRNFKKAVDRNRIKRLLRETYRLNKLPLHQYLEEQNQHLLVFFLYIDKALPRKGLLQTRMPLVIDELIKRLHETGA